jgi:hypothetical protein
MIPHYRAFLDYALRELQGASSLPDRVLFSSLQLEQKWLGPRRSTGILNRLDFLESHTGGEVISRLNQLLANVS